MPQLPPSVFTKRCEIRWRDMDAFQHVNNSVYLTYLEETRDEWFLEVLGNGLLLLDFVLARSAGGRIGGRLHRPRDGQVAAYDRRDSHRVQPLAALSLPVSASSIS